MRILIKKVEGLTLPRKAHHDDAGFDLFASSEPKIVGKEVSIGSPKLNTRFYSSIDYIQYDTNVHITPESEYGYKIKHYHTHVFPRSSLSRYSLTLRNGVSTIDRNYNGSILLRFSYIYQPEDLIMVDGKFFVSINLNKIYKKGDAIGQLIVARTYDSELIQVEALADTNRMDGGFGSTTGK